MCFDATSLLLELQFNMSYILCLRGHLQVSEMMDKEPIELEILDTVYKVQHVKIRSDRM